MCYIMLVLYAFTRNNARLQKNCEIIHVGFGINRCMLLALATWARISPIFKRIVIRQHLLMDSWLELG